MPRKATGPTGKKMGRPPKIFNWVQVAEMCSLNMTVLEICRVLSCDDMTLRAACEREKGITLSAFYNQHREKAKMSLRRMQWRNAKKGSDKMAIWLGIQELGQRNRTDITSGDEAFPQAQVIMPDNGRDPQEAPEPGQFGEGS